MRRLGAAGLLFVSGCSFIMVTGYKPPPAPPTCTSSHTAPGLDTTFAILTSLAAVATGLDLQDVTSGDNQSNAPLDSLILLSAIPLAVLFTASAIYGYVKVSDCRQAAAGIK
jgi:hypothetical protein